MFFFLQNKFKENKWIWGNFHNIVWNYCMCVFFLPFAKHRMRCVINFHLTKLWNTNTNKCWKLLPVSGERGVSLTTIWSFNWVLNNWSRQLAKFTLSIAYGTVWILIKIVSINEIESTFESESYYFGFLRVNKTINPHVHGQNKWINVQRCTDVV